MKTISVAKVLSYAIPLNFKGGGLPGWRVRFSFHAACGGDHVISVENAWGSSEFYYTEMRDIHCKDVEGGCPDADEDTVTTVELTHPNRQINDQRQGARQIFHPIPDFGRGLGQ